MALSTPCPFWIRFLSAEFLSKISKLFLSWKLTSNGFIWHPAKLIESYKEFTINWAATIFCFTLLDPLKTFFYSEKNSILTILFEHFFLYIITDGRAKNGPNPCKFDLGSLLLRLFDTYMSIIKLLHNGVQIFSKLYLYYEIVFFEKKY